MSLEEQLVSDMNFNTFKIVYHTAKNVRCWAENIRGKQPNQLHRDLGGMCAICSVEMFNRLKQNDFYSIIAVNNEHCFLICEDHLVDITARQFDLRLDKIEIRLLSKVKEPWWQIEKLLTTQEQFSDEFKLWPIEQRPKVI